MATTHTLDCMQRMQWTSAVQPLQSGWSSRYVGDIYDTSPYPADAPPEIAPYVKREKPQFIVTSNFITRMGRLISFISPVA